MTEKQKLNTACAVLAALSIAAMLVAGVAHAGSVSNETSWHEEQARSVFANGLDGQIDSVQFSSFYVCDNCSDFFGPLAQVRIYFRHEGRDVWALNTTTDDLVWIKHAIQLTLDNVNDTPDGACPVCDDCPVDELPETGGDCIPFGQPCNPFTQICCPSN